MFCKATAINNLWAFVGFGAISLLAYALRRQRKLRCNVLICGIVMATSATHADVFNMGGTRNPATGTWTGLASLEFVTVGNPGNAADNRVYDLNGNLGRGAVNDTYQMGKYQVTAGQYCEFLNAVAKADPYGLYTPIMNYDANPSYRSCNIKRSGASGDYSYSVAPDWANRPVNEVSWGDAARFINWLQNGQPAGILTGTPSLDRQFTEDGSYSLSGKTGWGDLENIPRNSAATFVIPNEDEWYKSAYYKGGGTNAGYWEYPTKSNIAPINRVTDPDPGNHANFYDWSHTGTGGFAIGPPYYRTPVGEYENSAGPYGTFDQGGNVIEWSEERVFGDRLCEWYRALCGVDYGNPVLGMRYDACCWFDDSFIPSDQNSQVGFRVAWVPEPGGMVLAISAGLCVLAFGLPRKARKSF
jgi:formylglycine-generating enzyme